MASEWAWLDEAACRDRPDWDDWNDWHALLKVCADCPVREPCLKFALGTGCGGVRGGTLPHERGWRNQRVPRGWSAEPWTTMRDGRPEPDTDPFDGIYEAMERYILTDLMVSPTPVLGIKSKPTGYTADHDNQAAGQAAGPRRRPGQAV